MARRTAIGIDIGTYQVKVVVAERERGKNPELPKILGAGYAESRGMHHGYIVNSPDATKSVALAVREAERTCGFPIRSAYISVGGVGLEEFRAKGEVVIARADMEVTDLDLEKVLEIAQDRIKDKLLNRKVLHVIPTAWRLDGERVLGRVLGMKGRKLEADVLFITSLEQHLEDLIAAVENAGVSVEDVMASPLAASFVTLTKADKKAGCVLANIGSETVSIAVYENNLPISVKVFPIGGTDITHDIALGLKVPLQEAELIKIGAVTGSSYPKKKLDDIIGARLSDIFDLIEVHLKAIDKKLLPAGVILTGGVTGLATIEDIARAALELPAKRYYPSFAGNAKVKDSTWAVAYGLTIFGLSAEGQKISPLSRGQLGKRAWRWVQQFLP